MNNTKLTPESENNLAEECKKALDKSYGFEVPLPKCATKVRRV